MSQTLYRKYRSQRFAELIGQSAVVRVLRNSITRERINVHSIKAQMIEPSYAQAFQYFSRTCKRRSLVIILTDLVDRDASAELLAHTATLLPRHLPDWRVKGARPARAAIWRRSRLPSSGISASIVRAMVGPTPGTEAIFV